MPSPPKTPNPPPPPPSFGQNTSGAAAPNPPLVASIPPAGTFLVELLIYNGSPFKDHWAYWVRSHADPDVGVLIHATGDVRNGFKFEVKRNHDFRATGNVPSKRIPLQWVDGKYFNESAMLNNGKRKVDGSPVCGFESSAYKVTPPGKTLNDKANSGKKITQKNCQTWIVESADQLVRDHMFQKEVATYLHLIKQ